MTKSGMKLSKQLSTQGVVTIQGQENSKESEPKSKRSKTTKKR
ncbi:hypothetical protein THF5H11_10882 [Vibrio jasicida]|nr:hypothetical protein THF5H11_10882 [Vibrio jasicida]